MMKRLASYLALFIALLPIQAFAATQPVNPADYTVSVHVTSAELTDSEPHGTEELILKATIGGKHIQLTGNAPTSIFEGHIIGKIYVGLLPPGNYKARLIGHVYKPAYLNYEEYEFLMPDNQTILFRVTGMYESSCRPSATLAPCPASSISSGSMAR